MKKKWAIYVDNLLKLQYKINLSNISNKLLVPKFLLLVETSNLTIKS